MIELDTCCGNAADSSHIHSGHFMKSNLEDDDVNEGELGLDVNFAETADGAVVFRGKDGAPVTGLAAAKRGSSAVSIDESLSKLLRYLSLTYSGKLTSPKWNEFRGMRFAMKDKVRLNNIIWREYYLQYVRLKRPKVVQFASPLSDGVHNKPESVLMEGKYWKRRVETVRNEYTRWRVFFQQKRSLGPSGDEAEPMDTDAEFGAGSCFPAKRKGSTKYERSQSPKDRPPRAPSANFLDEFLMDLQLENFENFLQSSDSLQFPTAKDFNQIGNSDFIQPNLAQLQPSIDDPASATDLLSMLTTSSQSAPYYEQPTVSSSSANLLHSLLQQQQQQQQAASVAQQLQSSAGGVTSSGGGSLFTFTPALASAKPFKQEQQQQQQAPLLLPGARQPVPVMLTSSQPVIKSEPQQPQQQQQQAPNVSHLSPGDQQKVIATLQLLLSKSSQSPPSVVNSLLQYLGSFGVTVQPSPGGGGGGANGGAAFIDLTLPSASAKVSGVGELMVGRSDQSQQSRPQPQPQQQQQQQQQQAVSGSISQSLYNILRAPVDSHSPSAASAAAAASAVGRQAAIVPKPEAPAAAAGSPAIHHDSMAGARPEAKLTWRHVRHSSERQAVEHSDLYQLHRRGGQLNSEQKRRYSINSGFDALHSLIPSLAANPHVKVSKAALLHKAADHIQRMKADRTSMERESEMLRAEIAKLGSDIADCCSRLPSTGIGMTAQKQRDCRAWFEEAYVKNRTLANWKFYIFSLIVSDLFDAFNTTVSTNALEDFARSVLSWIDQHCSLVKLRPAVQKALTQFSTSTSILSDPQAVASQVVAGVQARTLPLSLQSEPSLQTQSSASSWPDVADSDDECDMS